MHDNSGALAFTVSTIPPHIQDLDNLEIGSLSQRMQHRGFYFDEGGPSNIERPIDLALIETMGKGWKSKPNLVMIPLLMEIQPNLWKPKNSMWIHNLTKTQGK